MRVCAAGGRSSLKSTIDRRALASLSTASLGPVDIAPYADGEEADDQREQDPHGWQHPG
jgi:hypothetical protein